MAGLKFVRSTTDHLIDRRNVRYSAMGRSIPRRWWSWKPPSTKRG